MRAFTDSLHQLSEYEDIMRAMQMGKGLVTITGCIDAQKPHMIYTLGNNRKNRIIVTFHEQKAKELYEDYRFFDPSVVYYPAKDVLFYQSDIRGNLLTAERITALKAIREKESVTLITTYDALMNTMAPADQMWSSIRRIAPGDTVNLEELTADLVRMGYEKEYQVENIGQFAVRGGILDVFPLTEDNPVRIEMWGDEVDTIRSFDTESQKSIDNLEELVIYPACELVLDEAQKAAGIEALLAEAKTFSDKLRKDMKTEEAHRALSMAQELAEEWGELSITAGMDAYLSYFCAERVGLLDYFAPEDTYLFFDELTRSTERGKQTELEYAQSMEQRLEKGYILPGQMRELFGFKEIMARISRYSCVAVSALDNKTCGLTLNGAFGVHVKSVSAYNNSFELLIKDLKHYRKNGYKIILLSGSKSRAARLADDILHEDLNCFYTEDYDHALLPGQVMVCYGKVHRGYEYPILQFAVITETDIFGGEKKKKKRHRTYEGEKIQSFTDLAVGDYVVHENHGLGVYKGIEKIEVDKKVKDYIKIEYAGGSNLYILATQLELIQKYASKDARKPKLNKLGGQEWAKTKTRVRGAVKEIAQDLVKLYAAREKQDGYVYGPDTVWQREFEELFPFEETEDQVLAIEATKKDMESSKIMDRLICGDVGYGKTEIAIRAAFKAVQENKQVAYLAPTTILAQQIYNTFSQRMKDFPVRVDLLCRFRSAAEQKHTIEDLKKGQVDIVIGTHRILSKDVNFKDLGLLVVDEEQRFGVTHKEKIKQLKTNVDVLTLTATPIPRTLHMSLIGIRDMSVLEEPPMDRVPIQTYVMEYNEELVREAISRELARDGQVYYVYNKVKDIDEITTKIQALVPEANVAFAHGQMRETQLEDIMYRFINGDIDVLVSTTIIETGLDISNVNTMIIHDADNMGLSQLYQLRGRVGRSNRTAYAFLMYRRNKLLKEVAEKRLAAIKEYSDLGSGFKIAMRDLEIRGAGNLLGAEQSGHMEAVGYDLYCKMLHEAVREAKGDAVEEHFDTSVDVRTDAFIPTSYIANEFQKLDIYKRIAGIENQEESEEMLEELIDRFGEPPKSVQNLLAIARMKGMAHRVYIREIVQHENELKLTMYERAKVDPTKIPELIGRNAPALRFVPDTQNPYFCYTLNSNSREKNRDVMEVLEQLLEDMSLLLCGEKAADCE
ncbi:MAG: transcription-repair coupling factor [Agathobacter sp.]|nr:transcription-repair coupling factor [Agathobacter sp.]